MRSLLLPLAIASLIAPVVIAQEAAEPRTQGRLREVRVTTGDVFPDESASERFLERVVNALHWVTREDTIRRELWFQRGDSIDDVTAAEVERNLRALGLFAEVTVRLVPVANGNGEVDLEIVTRDRLTLYFGAGASYLGGVTGVRASVGDGNLFGLGNRLTASFSRNSDDEYRGNVTYSDLHVLDTWHTGAVRYSRTDDGDGLGLELRRPFKHLSDPHSYGVVVAHDETEVDYYRGGDSLAQVPDTRSALEADFVWGDGPVDRRRAFGFVLVGERHDYEPATGPLAADVRVPGDTDSVFFGPTARWNIVAGYRKVEGLDTLAYVQDLTLGATLGLTAGARWRDEDGAGEAEVQPEVAARVSWAAEPLDSVFTNLAARGGARRGANDLAGWNGHLGAQAYAMVHELDTLAANVAFDAVDEKQDLLRELTLGEDNGLRGYDAHQFSGTRRLLINTENRFDTGIEFATFRLGLVGFFDAGWVGTGDDLGRPYTSAGFGFRVGSKQLLGSNVLRIDFAKPLDDVPGESDGWTVSITAGQVFTFGG